MLPEDVQQDIISRIIIYGGGIPTAFMGWLNTNATGIQAACAVVVASVIVYRGYKDYKRKPRPPGSSKDSQ